jgi:hypothetical protein
MMHRIRHTATAQDILNYWRKNDGSVGLSVPIHKGGSNSGSEAMGFIPVSKLFSFHSEMNSATSKKWFKEQFILYLKPQLSLWTVSTLM